MTAIGDYCNVIRGWLNLGASIYPDVVVTSWVRMAEEELNEALRCKHMIQIDDGVLVTGRVLLPSDWLELDLVRLNDGNAMRYEPRDEFYDQSLSPQPVKFDSSGRQITTGRYTIIGNYLVISNPDAVNGSNVEIAYYQTIPPLGDTPNWVTTYYSQLYTIATLHVAAMYAIEDERGPMWTTQMDKLVKEINERHMTAKASGSRLVARRMKGFG